MPKPLRKLEVLLEIHLAKKMKSLQAKAMSEEESSDESFEKAPGPCS